MNENAIVITLSGVVHKIDEGTVRDQFGQTPVLFVSFLTGRINPKTNEPYLQRVTVKDSDANRKAFAPAKRVTLNIEVGAASYDGRSYPTFASLGVE